VNEDDEDGRDAKRRKVKLPTLDQQALQKMKKIFLQVHNSVAACVDETGRKRCELFKELPDRREYADYYTVIKQPIAMNQIRKRINSMYYKSFPQFRDDWDLIFSNARTYNQEGSWVYVDAEEMNRAFVDACSRFVHGSGIPGANSAKGEDNMVGSPMDEDLHGPSRAGKGTVRLNVRQVLSDDDDDYLSGNSDDD